MKYFMIPVTLFAASLLAASAFTPAETSDGNLTFYKDVLPVLQKNCQACHRPGQTAPMSLLTYENTRPWAKAIKQAVQTRKMPPWFASPEYGHFNNDRSLKQNGIDTLVKWIDSGAPAGDVKDAPPAIQWPDEWQIKPDIIVEAPPFDVPATGLVEWTGIIIPSGFTKDTWVTSVEVLPSQPIVTHHTCLTFIPHRPDVKYYSPAPRQVERDADGVEVVREGARRGGQGQQRQQGQAGPQNIQTGVSGGGIEECYEPGRQPADFRP